MSFGQEELDPDPDPSAVDHGMEELTFDLAYSDLLELDLPDPIYLSQIPDIHLPAHQELLNGNDMNLDESDNIKATFAFDANGFGLVHDAASDGIYTQNTPPESVRPEHPAF